MPAPVLKAFRCMNGKEKLLKVLEAFAASDEIRKSVEDRAFENPTLIGAGLDGYPIRAPRGYPMARDWR